MHTYCPCVGAPSCATREQVYPLLHAEALGLQIGKQYPPCPSKSAQKAGVFDGSVGHPVVHDAVHSPPGKFVAHCPPWNAQLPLTVQASPIDAVGAATPPAPVYFSAAAYFFHRFQKSHVPPAFPSASVGRYW